MGISPRHHRRSLGYLETGMSPATAGTAIASDANVDKSMVFVLSALLCALVLVLALNSILCCALRLVRRRSLVISSPAAAADTSRSGGSTTSTAADRKIAARLQIPETVYGEEGEAGVPSSTAAAAAATTTTECPICLAEFEGGERVRVLPRCRHGFHVECIDTWLETHLSCPICRQGFSQFN